MEKSFNASITVYQQQLEAGHIQTAYRGLMKYMMSLRTHFANEYPRDFTIGDVYPGYMDITYFPFTPTSLKRHKLKIGIVLHHEYMRFEIWLAGQNRQIQKKYRELFNGSDLNKYRIPPTLLEGFSIVDHVLVENPNFDDLDSLTKQIEAGSMAFIKDMVDALG